MKTQEFIDKWKHELKVSNKLLSGTPEQSLLLEEFEEDCWSISKEEKPRTPEQAFLNNWVSLFEMKNSNLFGEFAGDVHRLVQWAKKEAVDEFMNNAYKGTHYKEMMRNNGRSDTEV